MTWRGLPEVFDLGLGAGQVEFKPSCPRRKLRWHSATISLSRQTGDERSWLAIHVSNG